jgi:hypothetical protein
MPTRTVNCYRWPIITAAALAALASSMFGWLAAVVSAPIILAVLFVTCLLAWEFTWRELHDRKHEPSGYKWVLHGIAFCMFMPWRCGICDRCGGFADMRDPRFISVKG